MTETSAFGHISWYVLFRLSDRKENLISLSVPEVAMAHPVTQVCGCVCVCIVLGLLYVSTDTCLNEGCCVQWWHCSPAPWLFLMRHRWLLTVSIASIHHLFISLQCNTQHRGQQKLWWRSAQALHSGTSFPSESKGVLFSLHSEMSLCFFTQTQHHRHRQVKQMGEDSNSSVWISTLPLLAFKCYFIQMSRGSHTSSVWVLPPVTRVRFEEQETTGFSSV